MNVWPAGFADRTQAGVALADYTSIHIGGPARALVLPRDAADAAALLHALADAGESWRVLGGGSNLLVQDEPLDCVVVHPSRLMSFEIRGSRAFVGAGNTLIATINRTAAAGLGGLEALAGIPGQVGGAVAMNAGGRYGWISHHLVAADLALPSGKIETVDAKDLRLAYRRSELPPGALVVQAVFDLKAGDATALKQEARRITEEKNAAQPTQALNFGCAFTNPDGQSAGLLVEAAGLKGTIRGGARISPVHGNFVENRGQATAADVLGLIELMERVVRERSGLRLEREVRVWMGAVPE